MRDLPADDALAQDPLALWRGIDDAVWREATRLLVSRPHTLQADTARILKARQPVHAGPAPAMQPA